MSNGWHLLKVLKNNPVLIEGLFLLVLETAHRSPFDSIKKAPEFSGGGS